MTLTFDELKQAVADQQMSVTVDTSVGTVELHRMSVQQIVDFADVQDGQEAEFFVHLLSKCIAGADSNEGRETIAKLPVGDITRLGAAAMRLNHLDSDSDEAAKKN